MTVNIDPEFKKRIPALQPEEYAQLRASIKEEGCRDAIVLWRRGECDFVIVDGHNRFEICEEFGLQHKTIEMTFSDRDAVMEWMDRNQLGRRNLTESQTRILRGRLYDRLKKTKAEAGALGGVSKGKSDQCLTTSETIASEFGVSEKTIRNDAAFAREVDSDPALLETVMQGGDVKKAVREKNRTERIKCIVKEAETPEMPQKKYAVIYADPPWRYEHCETTSREIENQYPTMELSAICDLPVHEISTQNAILFLWATAPKLEEAMRVMNAWGFTYRTCAIWDKEVIGMGYYFRIQHELLLVGVRGDMPTPEPANRPSSVIKEKRGKHSKKPDQFHSIIEGMYGDLPKVELFARTAKDGWDAWGNQI